MPSDWTVADENFREKYGHYPTRVELPDPEPDPAMDALVARMLRRGRPLERDDLNVIEGDQT